MCLRLRATWKLSCMGPEKLGSVILRLACASAGLSVSAAAFVYGLRNPLASMADYTAALMILNQIAPPLLLAALPPPSPRFGSMVAVLFDPVLAVGLFTALSIAVSFPAILDPTLANALYAAPLGLLELLAGLLIWGQLAGATRQIRSRWRLAVIVWLASIPMAAVAVVWMLSSKVIFTPYLDVICRWDLPPLLDQKWAGFAMFAAGVPLQLAAAWVLLDPFAREASTNGRHDTAAPSCEPEKPDRRLLA